MFKTQLIEQLEEEHKDILKILEKIKENFSKKDQVLELLKEFNIILQEHLQKEDIDLYPFLEAEAKYNSELRNTMNVFADGLMNLGAFIKSFLSYSPQEINSLSWNRDFGKLYSNLKTRIRREENILYPYYKEM